MLREVKAVLADTDIEAKSSLFLSVNGYESKGAEPLVAAMEEAHEYVRGRKVEPIRNAFTSTYADLTVFAEVGIPASSAARHRRPPTPSRPPGRCRRWTTFWPPRGCTRSPPWRSPTGTGREPAVATTGSLA